MFLRGKKKLPEKLPEPTSKKVPDGVRVPNHLGDLWHILDEIAREEDPGFGKKSVVEHFNSCAEGQRDATRWLSIYQRRLDPSHRFSFPAHCTRHRGHVLVPRNWPSGVVWEAFDETTWKKVPVRGAADEANLIREIDCFLDSPAKVESSG